MNAMTADWAHYAPYQPPYVGPLASLSLAEARFSFDHWLAARASRWEQLSRLVAADGVTLGTSNACAQELNYWFCASLEPDADGSGRLSSRWYSVVNDVAVVLGDVLLERCPGLRWELFTRGGKSDVAFQKPVLTGFTKVPNLKFNLDIDRLVATHAHQVVGDMEPPRNYFVTVLEASQSRA